MEINIIQMVGFFCFGFIVGVFVVIVNTKTSEDKEELSKQIVKLSSELIHSISCDFKERAEKQAVHLDRLINFYNNL